MIPGTKNKNGSGWVTARHGGNGKGSSGPGAAPNPVNHTGAVNAKKGPVEGSPEEEKNETPAQEKAEGPDKDSDDTSSPSLHPYHAAIADELRNKHGLSHNASVRVGAGIVAAHAKGHAAIDSDTQGQAAEAHAHWNTMLKTHKKATAVSAPQHSM